jgi:hypothetical protein
LNPPALVCHIPNVYGGTRGNRWVSGEAPLGEADARAGVVPDQQSHNAQQYESFWISASSIRGTYGTMRSGHVASHPRRRKGWYQ